MNLMAAVLMMTICGTTAARAQSFFFSTGNADGRLGALSQPANAGKLETEAADDFPLTATTVIERATITGLINAPLANIANVEIEVYHVFPIDSVNPPSNNVPSRTNSPSDFEIDSATRDASNGTLRFRVSQLAASFSVTNTVITGINKKPDQTTHGEPGVTGTEVQIDIEFNPPIVLPAGSYFFRPEVLVTGGEFLYLSAPRPIVTPGTPFAGDRQAWIRNSALKPDWLRIGTDIIGGDTPPTFSLTFSLNGDTIPNAGTPGNANCHGKTITALTHEFGSIDAATSVLGFSSVQSLQDVFRQFCEP
jgi:hypothetical protein